MLCFSYSKREINFLACIISLFVCVVIYFIFDFKEINLHMSLAKKNTENINSSGILKNENNFFVGTTNENFTKQNNFYNQTKNEETKAETLEKEEVTEEKWSLEIPKINLKADIAEGTTEDILNKYIGHFVESQKDSGNVGLAAHNRGYKVNYFNRLKELEIGDEVFYTYKGITKEYEIYLVSIIDDTNWDVLENTKENTLTMITCVENEPLYRRCVKAKEK